MAFLNVHPADRARPLADATGVELAREPLQGLPTWRLCRIDLGGPGELPATPPGHLSLALVLTSEAALLELDHVPAPVQHRGQVLGPWQQGRCQAADDALSLAWFSHLAPVSAALWLRPVVGSLVLFREPKTRWLLHVLGGAVQVKPLPGRTTLAQGSSLSVDFGDPAAPGRLIVDGGGELLLVRLTPAG